MGMTPQPNLVVGAVGLAIALVTGAIVVTNWRTLTELEEYEASFGTHDVDFPVRSATLGAGAKRAEPRNITDANVTRVGVEVTWQDPSFPQSAPDVTLMVTDPQGKLRGQATHRGGSLGITLNVELVASEDVPTGTHRFSARNDPHAVFEQRWPERPEGVGVWIFELHNKGSGPQAGSIFYTIRTDYTYFSGTLREILGGGVK